MSSPQLVTPVTCYIYGLIHLRIFTFAVSLPSRLLILRQAPPPPETNCQACGLSYQPQVSLQYLYLSRNRNLTPKWNICGQTRSKSKNYVKSPGLNTTSATRLPIRTFSCGIFPPRKIWTFSPKFQKCGEFPEPNFPHLRLISRLFQFI